MRLYRPRTAESRIVNRLRETEGAYCTTADLIDAVWGCIPGGGPSLAAQAIRVYVSRLRKLGFPIHHTPSRGYRFIPSHWEIADMNEEKVMQRPSRKRGRMSAADYLPPLEATRLAATIDSLKRQVEVQAGAAALMRANADGWVAAKDQEIAELKKVIDELIKQRDAAWAKPENLVEEAPAA